MPTASPTPHLKTPKKPRYTVVVVESSSMSKPQMTWSEFRDEVDRILREKGISEDIPIWYIDISWPDAGDIKAERMGVFFDSNHGICVQ